MRKRRFKILAHKTLQRPADDWRFFVLSASSRVRTGTRNAGSWLDLLRGIGREFHRGGQEMHTRKNV